jgi:hypothetical protein
MVSILYFVPNLMKMDLEEPLRRWGEGGGGVLAVASQCYKLKQKLILLYNPICCPVKYSLHSGLSMRGPYDIRLLLRCVQST